MDTKCLLEFIFVFVLQVQVFSERRFFPYSRSGQDVVVPCASASPPESTCSKIVWQYNRNRGQALDEVKNGKVSMRSARAARLSVDSDCSLVINKVTAEDFGLYVCRQGGDVNTDVSLFLSILTISPSRTDADPKRDEEVTLECSLLRQEELGPCKENSIRWVDDSDTVLLGDGVGYSLLRQMNCVSVLALKRQSGNNRRFTCQFVENNNVKIEAYYTPEFSDPPLDRTYIIIGAVVGAVVVLVVIAVILIKYRKRAKVIDDVQKPTQHPDEPESNLTYVTVSHANQQASPYKKVKEEQVTYSTVNTLVKTEADDDPGSLYSNVSTPK